MHLNFRICNRLVALTSLAGLLSAPAAYAQGTVYNQTTNLAGSYTSQYDPTTYGSYATAYDNFTLSSTALIGSVTWAGDYFTGAPGGVTGFTIQFSADNAGLPGSVLMSEPIVGDANETFLGVDSQDNPAYTYSMTLPTIFRATGGTQYWMSIVADLSYPPQWGWEQATGGDGTAYQTYFSNGHPLSTDFAFSLGSVDPATIPEPGSIALFTCLGLAACLCLRRRKRTQKAI